jgi:plasmid stabilization system protein ParE
VKPCVLHPQAKADLLAAVEYYERESWPLAGRFSAEMERLVSEVSVNPSVFRLFHKNARRHFGFRFPYAVIYIERELEVQILGFAHFKRRPGYWVERLLGESL